MARRFRGLWHTFERAVVFFHVGAAVVSGVGWLVAYVRGLDRSVIVGLAFGFGYCLLVLTLCFLVWLRTKWKSEHRLPLRRRWELRRYTSAGLNWRISSRGEVQGKAVAILRVTSTSDLPQPLELVVTCLGRIEGLSASFYLDPARPTDSDRAAEIEIPYSGGQKTVSLILRSPKLHTPGYLDIVLTSAGNAEIRVLTVKRNPEGRGSVFWR